jgi:Ion channel
MSRFLREPPLRADGRTRDRDGNCGSNRCRRSPDAGARGYGDVTPQRTSGRIFAAFVMLQGIVFLTITVAAVTSTFVVRQPRSGRSRKPRTRMMRSCRSRPA